MFSFPSFLSSLPQQVSLFAPGVLEPPFTTPITTASTYTFERLGVGYGFVLYRTNLTRELNQTKYDLSLPPYIFTLVIFSIWFPFY